MPPNINAAVAETANGTAFQRQSGAHDPFTPLVLPGEVTGPTGATGAQSSGGSSSGGRAPAARARAVRTGSGWLGRHERPDPERSHPERPDDAAHQHAAVQQAEAVEQAVDRQRGLPLRPRALGRRYGNDRHDRTDGSDRTVRHHGAVRPLSDLQDYNQPKTNTPLPDSNDTILTLIGAGSGGTSLEFSVRQELFISGPGTCLPSATNCQEIDLLPGDVETLQYDSPTLGLVQYELAVVSVNGHTAGPENTVRHAARRAVTSRTLDRRRGPHPRTAGAAAAVHPANRESHASPRGAHTRAAARRGPLG